MKKTLFCAFLPIFCVALGVAQELKPIQLPPAQPEGGKPLMRALQARHSSREFSADPLSDQTLSNLLWAAFGVNRPDSGKRTAPSAMNWQEIDIYVATAGGLYLFKAESQSLNPVLAGDIRASTGTQPFVTQAPVNLVYVADLSKTAKATEDERELYIGADVGFIAQNVYLFCASEGLATVVRGSLDRPALAKLMRLRADQKIVLAQSAGHPQK